MAEQRVADEQLTEWERDAKHSAFGRRSLALIADLRASRAREAELAEALQSAMGRAEKWCVEEEARTAERDVLQQRIDTALAWCEKANPLPHLNGDQFKDIRAALTGTEPE